MPQVLFYFFSAAAVLSALFVILLNKPTRALLSLIITMFSLTVIYLLLGAPFVAMVHLVVYAGAVLVLFLFVIMLQGIDAKEEPLSKRFRAYFLFVACFVAVCFSLMLASLLGASALGSTHPLLVSVETFGLFLFKNYTLPFELTSVLLLLGVFAAVSLAKKDSE
jgi:NADH-quinone oxidoreductase subunit J